MKENKSKPKQSKLNKRKKGKKRHEIISEAFKRLDKCREYQKRDNWTC